MAAQSKRGPSPHDQLVSRIDRIATAENSRGQIARDALCDRQTEMETIPIVDVRSRDLRRYTPIDDLGAAGARNRSNPGFALRLDRRADSSRHWLSRDMDGHIGQDLDGCFR